MRLALRSTLCYLPTRMSDESKTSFFETQRGRIAALVVAAIWSVVLLLGNLGGIGIWEPWEAHEITVAQEYVTRGQAPEVTDPKATSWNGAVPTNKQRPVNRPLLKTLLISVGVGDVTVDAGKLGSLERQARLPIALCTLLLAFLMLAWLARRFGALGASVATIAFVSSPAIFIGTHNLASEMLFVVTTSLAIMAFAELMFDPRRRWLWGTLFGLALALCVLDQRLLGLYVPLLVLAAFAAGEVTLGEAIRRRDGPSAPARFGKLELGGVALAALAIFATAFWATTKRPGEGEDIPVHIMQLVALIVPALTTFGLMWFGRKSRPGRAFFSLPGLGGLAIGIAAAIALARMYSAANPILLDGGELVGEVRVLGFMLANHVFESGLADSHLTFDVAVRQVGFSLFPWVALFPLGFVYLSGATATRDEHGSDIGPELFDAPCTLRRLMLSWIVVTALVMAAASGWQHYFYPAYLPIAAAIGLALTDREFWRRAFQHPLSMYATGFVAITIVLMLGKDLERFPARFIETYLMLQDGFEFPDDFVWSKAYKPLKYLTCAVLAAHFFGLVSWGVLTVRRAKRLPEVFRAVRERRWSDVLGPEPDDSPFVHRMKQKQAVREESGVFGAIARVVETPRGYGMLLATYLAIVAAAFLFVFVPNVTHHVSQRGVFETYTRLADDGEKLWRYQVSSRDNSIYLTDVEMIRGAAQFGDLVEADERFFAIVPRSKLASISYDVRKRFKRNMYVVDARSSRLLLISNKLDDGETDQSFVNDKIVEGEPQIDFPVTYESGGEKKHAVFDKQLEFLGYSLDKKPQKDGFVAYSWGDEMVITYFFRVLERVPSSQKIFLHVDYPGTRINGDHVPNNGDFPTNYWLPGDIVKDVQPLKIDSYSTPGIYTMHMGFFLGSRRMDVEPREAHDGRNRITIGKIRVEGL